MLHNFFFLKRLSRQLNERLAGFHLQECFSQNKDELVAGFSTPSEQLYLRASLDPQISLLSFSGDFKRARKNSANLFPELTGRTVTSVRAFQYERSFSIGFDEAFELIFKMHASRSNLLLAKEGRVIEVFRHQLPGDLEIDPASLNQKPDLTQQRFNELEGNLAKFLPALGKEVRTYLSAQGYQTWSLNEQWVHLQQVIKELESNPIFIYQDEKPVLSLLKQDLEILLQTNDPVEAANRFYELYTRDYYLNSERRRAMKVVEAQIRKTENYLAKTTQKLAEVKNRRSYEELANLIMANLHQISQGSEKVRLFDLYNGKEIELNLKPELTPQKNAENLYRKSKNQKIEIGKLEENIRTRKDQLDRLKEELAAIRSSGDFKSLRKEYGHHQEKTAEQPSPYHRLTFRGFEILIGKNARNNDQLTLKEANKDDLWLHAKDVTGSHVVIRHQAGKVFPKDVLERAGELAAWFSKRKTDSLCPVIYTPKKFVRKRKGDPPGAVIVAREEVMMVEPKGI